MAKFLSFRDGGKTDENGISQYLSGLFNGEVINGLQVAQSSPLGLSVDVSQGRCMIDSGSDYPYLGFTDGIETVTLTTADGSNPRIDSIVAYVDLAQVDNTNSNNPDAFDIVAVAGTPAGSPNAPSSGTIESAIGGGNPYIILANVTVGAGVSNITNGNVSDQRELTDVVIRDGAISTNALGQSVVTTGKLAPSVVIGKTSPYSGTITSGSYIDVPDSSVTFNLESASKILLTISARTRSDGSNSAIYVSPYIDSTATDDDSIMFLHNVASSAAFANISRTLIKDLSAGEHTIKLQTRKTGSSGTNISHVSWAAIVVSQSV